VRRGKPLRASTTAKTTGTTLARRIPRARRKSRASAIGAPASRHDAGRLEQPGDTHRRRHPRRRTFRAEALELLEHEGRRGDGGARGAMGPARWPDVPTVALSLSVLPAPPVPEYAQARARRGASSTRTRHPCGPRSVCIWPARCAYTSCFQSSTRFTMGSMCSSNRPGCRQPTESELPPDLACVQQVPARNSCTTPVLSCVTRPSTRQGERRHEPRQPDTIVDNRLRTPSEGGRPKDAVNEPRLAPREVGAASGAERGSRDAVARRHGIYGVCARKS